MAQTSTLIHSFLKGKNSARLLLLLLFCVAGVMQASAQTPATLPTSHDGPWPASKTGWVFSNIGTRAGDMGNETIVKGGAALFSLNSSIEITFDDVAAQASFYIKENSFRSSRGSTFEVYEKDVNGEYTLADRKVNPVNSVKGEKITVSLKPDTRTVRLVLSSIADPQITVSVDDIVVTNKVPKINIKQGNTQILSSSGSYSFGRRPVGSQSEAVVFTIENLGTADLELSGNPIVKISGLDASDFTVDFSATATVVEPDKSTTFAVVFNPTDPLNEGAKSALITIVNNDGEFNPYTFTLTGESVNCPEVSGLEVYEGIVGRYIYIYGAHLDKAIGVTFGGVEASFGVVDNNTIDVQVPEGALSGPVVVYSADCSAQSVLFTVLKPTITISKTEMNLSANVGESVKELYQVSAEYLNDGASISLNLSGEYGDFSISESEEGPFVKSITITDNIVEHEENGSINNRSLAPVNIWVKYSPISSGNTSAAITHETADADAKVLTINATAAVAPLRPLITITETQMSLSANVGASDISELYQVSAVNLNDGASVVVDVSGLEGEYTISRSTDGPWVKTITFTTEIRDNTLEATELWVKFSPTVSGISSASITHSSEGAETKILTINGTAITPLPVELISFNAIKQSDAVLLTWATASEQNNNYFDVEVAEDPKAEFKAVGKVYSKVNTSSIKQNYQFRHVSNFTGTRYYRLKQVDLDGTLEYSKVVAVESRANGIAAEMKVYPNPVTPESKLIFPATEAGKLNVTVVNMSGSRVDSKSYDIEAGENRIELNLSSNLPAGIYILMTEFSGQTQQVKLIKQ